MAQSDAGLAFPALRCNQAIADFADSIFGEDWGFDKTTSKSSVETGHDDVFVVHPDNVDAYMATFEPSCLRHSAASAKDLKLPFINFGIAKGMSVDRVLIAPTGPMTEFLRKGKPLEDQAACALYVAVTRARSPPHGRGGCCPRKTLTSR